MHDEPQTDLPTCAKKAKLRIPEWVSGLSIAANTVTCGPRGYSLCARFYEMRLTGKRPGRTLTTITDRIFFWDAQHCRKAWLLRTR